MEYPRAIICRKLYEHFGNDNRRIEHALHVLHHADNIMPQYQNCDPDIVVAAALLHDVGIKPSEAELGYNNGITQEQYGPPIARRLLLEIGFPSDKIEKVAEIIGNHHSPSRFDYPELEILKKADLIVNRDEKV